MAKVLPSSLLATATRECGRMVAFMVTVRNGQQRISGSCGGFGDVLGMQLSRRYADILQQGPV